MKATAEKLVRVRIKGPGMVKLGRDHLVTVGQWVELPRLDAEDLVDAGAAETEDQIEEAKRAAAARAKSAEPKPPTPLFAQLRAAAIQQREMRRQAHEADRV